MFCADYLASFVFHVTLTLGFASISMPTGSSRNLIHAAVGSNKAREDLRGMGSFITPFCFGALSGICGGVAVFPFDFVRAAVMSQKLPLSMRLLHSLSAVPYASAFFGIYFSCRTPRDLKSQASWALTSSLCAVAAEAPFDQAKRVFFQNRRALMLGANLLYAPFAAMMLIAYDNALQDRLSPK
jgi:hypothetical protein